MLLRDDPLRAALDVFIEQKAHVSQGETTDVEAKELSRVAGAQFKADVRGRGVLEAGVLDLAGDLILGLMLACNHLLRSGVDSPRTWAASQSRARLLVYSFNGPSRPGS